MIRILVGILFAPWLYVIVWTLPMLDHSAFHKWVVINTFFAYLVFLVLAGVAHLMLRRLNRSSLWSYCVVMFIVAAFLDFVLSIWSLTGFSSNYYSQTQVVENGAITVAGYLLQIREALVHGLLSSGVMAIFWLAAIWNPNSKTAQP
jgi:hypothetical protein